MKKHILTIATAAFLCLNTAAQTQLGIRPANGGMKAIPVNSIARITFADDRLSAVDLALPSHTLWASCNLGAVYPDESGDFFAWGEASAKTTFTQQNYKHYIAGHYVSLGTNISAGRNDGATEALGSQWALPTAAQLQELIDNCTWTWSRYNGTKGYTVTGTNGNSIFLPAAGNMLNGSTHDNTGTCGFYWSANSATTASKAQFLGFKNGERKLQENMRDLGFCIRPVAHQPQTKALSLNVGSPTGTPLQGIGVEFDPHFLTACMAKNDGARPADWDNIIVPRVKKMRPHNFRVWVLSQWFEPVNDNNDPNTTNWDALNFNTPEMQALYKELDLAEETGAEVTLVFWGASANTWMAGGQTGNWLFVPKDYNEWAENCAILAKHLIDTKHYTCVKMLTPINEPNFYPGHWQRMTAEGYASVCHKIAAQLQRMGIAHKISLNLSDNIDSDVQFLKEACARTADVAGMFNTHCYKFGYENTNAEIGAWERTNVDLARAVGRKHFVGEFGSNRTVAAARQTDIDFYRRGILIDRLVLNFLNNGASGCSYWQLFDSWYSAHDSYPSMQQIGMWRYVKDAYRSEPYYHKLKYDYEPRPQYYAYSMLTCHVRPGAMTYPIATSQGNLTASAFKNTDGKWVYVFANPDDTSYTISLNNSYRSTSGTFDVYRYLAAELPYDDALLPVVGHVNGENHLQYTVPATSIIMLKER